MRALFSKLLMLQTWSLVLQSLNEMFYSLYHISKFSTYYYFMSYFLPHNTLNFLFRFLTSALKKIIPTKFSKILTSRNIDFLVDAVISAHSPKLTILTYITKNVTSKKWHLGLKKRG